MSFMGGSELIIFICLIILILEVAIDSPNNLGGAIRQISYITTINSTPIVIDLLATSFIALPMLCITLAYSKLRRFIFIPYDRLLNHHKNGIYYYLLSGVMTLLIFKIFGLFNMFRIENSDFTEQISTKLEYNRIVELLYAGILFYALSNGAIYFLLIILLIEFLRLNKKLSTKLGFNAIDKGMRNNIRNILLIQSVPLIFLQCLFLFRWLRIIGSLKGLIISSMLGFSLGTANLIYPIIAYFRESGFILTPTPISQ